MKKAKKKSVAKKAVKVTGSKLKIVNIKVGSKDRALLTALAKKYAKGNLSGWLRYAGLQYVPKRGETIGLDPAPKRK